MQTQIAGYYDAEDAAALARQLLDETEQHGVVFQDMDGTIRGWNHGAVYITGFTAGDVLGKSGSVLYMPEDRERRLDEHELQTALVVGAAQDERWHLRKDGAPFWSSGVCVPLRNRAGAVTGFMKVFRDRSQLHSRLKSLENALQEQARQLEQRDIFLGTIAHELRNPLSPIKAAIRIIEMLVTAESRLEQAIKIIHRQLAAMERLVEDLVDTARLKTGRLTVVYGPAELQALVANAVNSCRPAAAHKQIEVHTSVPSVPIALELDAGRMHQVLVNLLNNAIKYTPAGGSVWITATTDQTHALFLVRDNGIGVGPDLLPRIFDMFAQAQSDSQRGSGLGIGLALVKQVVELHLGTVEVESGGPGKGSEFIVRIPQRPPRGA